MRGYLYQLSRSLAYLWINHPSKWVIDWLLPSLAAGIATTALMFFGHQLNMFSASGVVDKCLGFIQALPGFYIAALAAIATFGRTDIDFTMPGNPPPSITQMIAGKSLIVQLTRRRFLCLLFSFLTVECIVLTLGSIVVLVFAPHVSKVLSEGFHVFIFYFSTFIYFLFLSQLLIATLWGLYYLGDKIHQPNT